MVPWLLTGIALLLALLVLARLFAAANPRTLVQVLKWSAIVLALLLAVVLVFRGQAAIAAVLGGLAALLWRAARFVPPWAWFRMWQSGRGWWRARQYQAGPTGAGAYRAGAASGARRAGASRVETPWLAMALDHASGEVDGEVLQGRFRGRGLGTLTLAELFELRAACASDARSCQLLDAFLDRRHGDWRAAWEAQQHAQARTGAPSGETMTRAEALQILGLGPEAGEDEIKEAHRRLIKKFHPDAGGSDYFAAKLNQAKQVLLGH